MKCLQLEYGVPLRPVEVPMLDDLPEFPVAPVGAVLVALEAKAAMTAHVKALPRLHDELNSSHVCVYGASAQALAIAYVHVNAAERFVSSVTNNDPLDQYPVRYTVHKQPCDAERVVQKIRELPRDLTTRSSQLLRFDRADCLPATDEALLAASGARVSQAGHAPDN